MLASNPIAMSKEDRLLALLQSLPNQSFKHELDFTRKIVPQFLDLLGYAETETFYEYKAGQYRADVVLSSSIISRPWIVLEVKNYKSRNVADWLYQLKRYLEIINCRVGVVLSPELLFFVKGEKVKRFDLRSLSLEQVREIMGLFARDIQTQTTNNQASLQGKLVELLAAVEEATTNEKKGRTLEALAQFLFNAVPSLNCKYANLQTRSSEIDLVVEYDCSKGLIPLFEELGRYCLVECKNWSKPVGVGPVRDFMGKLDKCKARLGIIFSKSGVTGVDAGADALREIQSRFDRDGVYLLVFSLEDVKNIDNPSAFLSALDSMADNLRFDARGC